MNTKFTKNQKLDAAMKDLLDAAGPSDAELDAIAARPFVYESIRHRINTDAVKIGIRRRPLFNLTFASLLVAAVTAALTLFAVDRGQRLGSPTTTSIDEIVTSEPQKADPADDFFAEFASVAPPQVTRKKTSSRPQPNFRKEWRRKLKKPGPVETPPLPETFYALDHSGSAVDTLGGGRVVRVDVPRSSLFAMGVNVPLENESASLPADVMLGPDGVARAIRLIE